MQWWKRIKNVSRVFQDKHTQIYLKRLKRDWVSKLNSRLSFYYHLPAAEKRLDKSLMWSGIWSVITTRISFNQKQLQSDLPDTDWSRKWLDFNAGKTQQFSFDKSNNNGATNVKMYGSVIAEKSSFKILGFTFSSKLDWGLLHYLYC